MRSTARRGIGILFIATLAAAASLRCGPPDGVLTVAFGLAPAQNLILPTEAELGVPLSPFDLSNADGRLDANVEGRSLQIEISGLPPITTSLTGPYYRFVLLVADEPVSPQSGLSPKRLLGFLAGTPACHAHGEPERVDLGRITPDPVGVARLVVTGATANLANIEGGVVEIVVPEGVQRPKTFVVLEGEVGNLEDETPTTPPTSGGGHHHHG